MMKLFAGMCVDENIYFIGAHNFNHTYNLSMVSKMLITTDQEKLKKIKPRLDSNPFKGKPAFPLIKL